MHRLLACFLSASLAAIVLAGCNQPLTPVSVEGAPDGEVDILTLNNSEIEHTAGSFLEQINRRDDVPVVVDFWATWCGPCVMMSPELDSVKKEWGDKLVVLKVDVDKNPDLASHFNISAIPHVRIFRTGKAITGFTGLKTASQINSLLKSLQ